MNEPAKKMTLTDLVAAWRAALWQVDEAEGELMPDLEAELDALDTALGEKADRCLLVAQEFEAMAAVHAQRAEIQLRQAKALSRQAERLREYVRYNLEAAEIQKLPTEHFPKLGLTKPKARTEVDVLVFLPHAVAQGEEDLLRRRDPEPDKKAIKTRLDAGEEIPGCSVVFGKPGLTGWK